MTEAEVQRLMGLAERLRAEAMAMGSFPDDAQAARVESARAALESALREALQPAGHLNSDDVFTLIGYAAGLRMDGKTDMPAYFERLAARIARAMGDEAMAARVEEVSAAPTTAPATAEESSGVAAPAAPEVPADARDAARLDWLLRKVSGAEFRRLGIVYAASPLRSDIDAAMAAPAPQEPKP